MLDTPCQSPLSLPELSVKLFGGDLFEAQNIGDKNNVVEKLADDCYRGSGDARCLGALDKEARSEFSHKGLGQILQGKIR
jgi:hypothetical protein